MNFEENGRRDLESVQRIQERIQFYYLTLTFTMLALAIETYKPGIYKTSSVVELISWLFLLISGLLGLYRMRMIPKYYKLSVHQNMLRWNIKDAQELKLKGEKQLYLQEKKKVFDIDMYIEENGKGIEYLEKKEKELTRHLKPFIRIHEVGLMLGIFMLAFGRAYETIVGILCT